MKDEDRDIARQGVKAAGAPWSLFSKTIAPDNQLPDNPDRPHPIESVVDEVPGPERDVDGRPVFTLRNGPKPRTLKSPAS